MSRIDRAEIERIATLSRLELAGGELDAMTEQMKKIVDFVSALDELDTAKVSPRLHGADGASSFFRRDEPGPSLTVDEALANAPERGPDGFRVPAVLE
jgi:aspartyl-tRNA(Asn)/glutamyl-tRNA(Gln) amidotransferase subunit C